MLANSKTQKRGFNKAFTLLEILSIIVIIAIIALITTPLVLRAIKNYKKEQFRVSAKVIYKAADDYESKKIMNGKPSYCSIYNFADDKESDDLDKEELDILFGEGNYEEKYTYRYEKIEKLSLTGKLPTKGIVFSCHGNRIGKLGDGEYMAVPDGEDVRVEEGDDFSLIDPNYVLIKSISTRSTIHTIAVTVDARVPSDGKIKTYEYSIDGKNYYPSDHTYTFENLDPGTEYKIRVRITTNSNLVTEDSVLASTEFALLSVTANGYSGTYDGKAHGITVTSSGATIRYGTASGSYTLTSSPTYTNAGTYTVYYQVTRKGYKTIIGSKTVTIAKANGAVTLSSTSGSIVNGGSTSITVTKNTGGGAITCSTSNASIATCSVSGSTITIKATAPATGGTATITVTSAATTNYKQATATYQATVLGKLSVTANGYSGTYDGKAHGITVTSSGATIRYGKASGSYTLTSSPTYTNAGTYTVYYQVTRAGYSTVTGSKTVTIAKANGAVTLSATSGSIVNGGSTSITVTKNTGGGAITCSTSNASIATCSVSGSTITIKATAPATGGTATITVTSAATTNYKQATATYQATVLGKLSVTANGYSGTYDGKAHGITVTSSGATIRYGTASGSYTLTSSPTYTNAGTYTVYYQVTRAGYSTVTGSKTVVISKKSGSVTLSPTSGKGIVTTAWNVTVNNVGGGTLSCKTSNSNIAVCSVTDTTHVKITSKTTAAGSATITITRGASTNYNAASATFAVTTTCFQTSGNTITGYLCNSKSVSIPSTVLGTTITTIGNGALAQKGLTSVTIASGIKTIGVGAFENNSITSYSIPSSVTSIGGAAFNNNLIESNPFIYARKSDGTSDTTHLVSYGGKATSITVPSSVKKLGAYSLSGNQLTSVSLPSNLVEIGYRALYNNNFNMHLYIPKTVTHIAEGAFGSNPNTFQVYTGDYFGEDYPYAPWGLPMAQWHYY